MTASFKDDPARSRGRRGFTVLGLGAGAVLAAMLVALATRDIGAAAEPMRTDSAPAALPDAADTSSAVAGRPAPRLDDGVDWQQVTASTDFAPAAVAAYER